MTQNRGNLEQGQEIPEMDPHLQLEWQWVSQSSYCRDGPGVMRPPALSLHISTGGQL